MNSTKTSSAPITQTTTERQRAYRARKAAAELSEVRGIYLPQALHAALKEHARKLLKQTGAAAS